MRVFEKVEDLRELEGQDIGCSDWCPISQEMIDTFAELTNDRHWIHIDPDKSKKMSPFGTTVAHGYLILSLTPSLMREIFQVENVTFSLNCGLDDVKFAHPVKVGERIALKLRLGKVRRIRDSWHVLWHMNVINEAYKLVCSADYKAIWSTLHPHQGRT